MHWLYLLLAFTALTLAIFSNSPGMLALWLLATAGLFLAWARGWYVTRIGGDTRGDASMMIDPLELRQLREQAAARRAQADADADAGDKRPLA